MQPLPIDEFVPGILSAARGRRAVVVTAAPGAGKTTRVPPALAEDGAVILLQPRRVAARSIARRIAEERGWTLGDEVGWQVRFERRFSSTTRLLVATEGVLTARLQTDPLLSGFLTVVIDEFHERSVHADLGLALAKQAWRARDDLRLVVMSATLDAARVAAFLDDCPVVEVPGRQHPLEIGYRPGVDMAAAIVEHAPRARGATLCFLPGAPEIHRAASALASARGFDLPVLPLYGGMDAELQDTAIRPADDARVILATNIAETTLTVPDVVSVIDSGLHKVARYDPDRAIDSLDTERISRDSADQRAGRAGRTGPGSVLRLWDERDRLRPHREPEIARVDLASVVLDVVAWGGDPRAFDWFDAPPPGALDAAIVLLERLGAIDSGGADGGSSAVALTALGRDIRRLPLHPRLARLLLAAGGAPEAARACALLSERRSMPVRHAATSCDLLAAVDRAVRLPPHIERVATELGRAVARVRGQVVPVVDETTFREAVFSAYPDRVARRREPLGDRVVLSSGAGARLARESGVINHEFLVAVDVTSGSSLPGADALIRMATGIEREWLVATSEDTRHELTDTGAVRAVRVERYDALVMGERQVAVDPHARAAVLADAWRRRDPDDATARLMRRVAFAGLGDDVSLDALVMAAASKARRLDDVRPAAELPGHLRHALDKVAPETLTLPSGRPAKLDYRDDGRIVAAVKLQELFGLADTPRLGSAKTPVTFELLAPNGRPVQVTTDLRSFWTTGYPEVRKELRARYPRHPWPEDPWSATPTARTVRRRGSG